MLIVLVNQSLHNNKLNLRKLLKISSPEYRSQLSAILIRGFTSIQPIASQSSRFDTKDIAEFHVSPDLRA